MAAWNLVSSSMCLILSLAFTCLRVRSTLLV
jgi:hypothetical protein